MSALRIEWLRALRAVMQAGTVTGAAAIVYRTQPQVSRMIGALEVELRFKLFTRDGRRLIPTAEGIRFYEYIGPLLAGLDSAPHAANDIRAGRGIPLRIAVEPFMLQSLIPNALGQIYRQPSARRYTVEVCSRQSGVWAARSHIQLAIAALPFVETDMDRIRFAECDLLAIIPKRLDGAMSDKSDFTALHNVPFIAYTPSSGVRERTEKIASELGVNLNVVAESSSGSTVCALAAQGIGVALADPILARSFAGPDVTIRLLEGAPKLMYGFLVPRADHIASDVEETMQSIMATAKQLGGEYLRLTKPIRQ